MCDSRNNTPWTYGKDMEVLAVLRFFGGPHDGHYIHQPTDEHGQYSTPEEYRLPVEVHDTPDHMFRYKKYYHHDAVYRFDQEHHVYRFWCIDRNFYPNEDTADELDRLLFDGDED